MQKIELKNTPKIDIPQFICDDFPLAKGQLKYPLHLLDKYHICLFIGRAGSGKTSMIVNLLSNKDKSSGFRKRFDNIIVVMPKSSRQSLKKNIFDKELAEENLFSTLDESVMDMINEMIDDNRENNENTLIILDDVTAALKKSIYLQNQLNKLIWNRRHKKLCIWIAQQNYTSLSLSSRKNISHAFLWKPSKKEFTVLFEELFELKQEKSLEIMKLYQKPHDFIFIDVYNQKIFRNFDTEIIFENI